ncbi:membrane stabilizing protein MspA [Staphylococcus sp. IVB6246]|uniref:membrane stabilizing protein MspA n=1 Tax=unclassified Staphylococcus TaxID=91994 RepID=UPI0021CF85D9|nr:MULTISPECIES: membrane stabilizing protein MspA [unclassified Staphylococcus]UXR69274.1 membrane stabilizing protein MspA [Staphylococcus sp. IVB6246]UXR71326.1 membrane stabilizing protein MspA [Staphylococcus sp. IVB6240]
MITYLILLPLMYLIVAYISIFKLEMLLPKILRFLMAILLIIVVTTSLLYYPSQVWWLVAVLLMLIGNVEITAFKHHKRDAKGVQILNMMTLLILVVYIAVTIIVL